MIALCLLPLSVPGRAQVAPSATEVASYTGLFNAAASGDVAAIDGLIASGAKLEERDENGRTPFHVAAYQKQRDVMAALVKAGADPNALDEQAYDAVTIAAVADDVKTLKTALVLGNKSGNVTSPYDGTALIAAAHLGHDEVVRILIEAGAPLDHVNNLGWTALIEAVVLGDGGARHQKTVEHLVKAGADRSIGDRDGVTPLEHAKNRSNSAIAALLTR